jgi:hypothetical protein
MSDQWKVPDGYRQSITTAITVFLGFSLTFLRTLWGVGQKEGWTFTDTLAESIISIGILMQVTALFRALNVFDDRLSRYKFTITTLKFGVAFVVIGVLFSIFARR